jgi:SAM-dependent MidA family methyltransferase
VEARLVEFARLLRQNGVRVSPAEVADAARAAGLDLLGYTSQAHFLLNCGLIDLLKADSSHARANEAHRLLSEAEMGELFKVIALGRRIDAPLRGFIRGDRSHVL